MNLSLLREMRHGLVHLFYPRLCEGCSKPLLAGEEVLCLGCVMHIPETGYHHIADNDTAMRFAGRVPFMHATTYAWFTHEGLLQHLLHGLKYRDRKEIGRFLGHRFAQSLERVGWVSDVDLIVPVPLHPARKATRGYNQSMLIAEAMGRQLGIAVSEDTLLRTRDTESQTRKTRTERVNNMEGAFKVADGTDLVGRHILICDDVLTTGATLEACALALMTEKNIKISIATIGIAVS